VRVFGPRDLHPNDRKGQSSNHKTERLHQVPENPKTKRKITHFPFDQSSFDHLTIPQSTILHLTIQLFPLKILHIIDSGGLYGAEIMLLNLVAEQVKLGLEPVIVSIGEKGIDEKPLEAEANRRDLAVRKFRMRPGPNLFGALKVLRYAWRGGFDLLHSHGYKGNILFGFFPKSFRKLPIVSTLHGYVSMDGITRMRAYECLDRWSLRFIDAVVLVNQAMRNHSRLKKLSGINFEVVNNGIPVSSEPPDSPLLCLAIQPFDHLTQKIINFCSNGFTLGSIGRLSDEKGFNYLIEALHALRQRGADVRLVIIGEGNQRFILEKQIAALGLDDCVLLPGYVRSAKHLIACFDVFAIPSLTEGLPIALLEAMQAQVPVVATAVGGMPEVLDHGRAGVLVDPGEHRSLADGIMKYFSDPNLSRQTAAKAFERVNSCYNSRFMAEEYLKIYEKVEVLN